MFYMSFKGTHEFDKLLTRVSKYISGVHSKASNLTVYSELVIVNIAHLFMKEMVKKLFWSIENSGEILNKLKSRGFLASGLSTYDFSTLYTTLPHNLIKEINRIN